MYLFLFYLLKSLTILNSTLKPTYHIFSITLVNYKLRSSFHLTLSKVETLVNSRAWGKLVECNISKTVLLRKNYIECNRATECKLDENRPNNNTGKTSLQDKELVVCKLKLNLSGTYKPTLSTQKTAFRIKNKIFLPINFFYS